MPGVKGKGTSRRIAVKVCFLLTVIILLVVVFLAGANKAVVDSSASRLYPDAGTAVYAEAGVVPGTRPGGFYFRNRIETAASLYHAGKVKWLIVSGDNRRHDYNEPQEMYRALVAKGVPAEVIYCDYAGFTTLDTVLRARDIFAQNKIIIISQKFHNQRAIYLALKNGIEATGVNAADVAPENRYWAGHIREYVARGRAVLDATVLKRQPYFGGDKIIPGKTHAPGCMPFSDAVDLKKMQAQ